MDEFFKLTAQMRAAQKKYYGYHGDVQVKSELLVRSKELERIVDKAIASKMEPQLKFRN